MTQQDLPECPYHNAKPWQLGFNFQPCLDSDGNEVPDFKPSLSTFKDAMLFGSNCTVFCPQCAAHRPPQERHNRFGFGYCSQTSLQEARRNWAKACRRFAASAIKAVLEGK